MGVISRQAFKQSVVNYIGVGIGFISTIWIYPLQKDMYGLAQWMYSMAYLILPFASFGITSVVVRFFPEFKTDDRKNNGFLFLLLALSTGSFILFFGVGYLLRDVLLSMAARADFDVDLIRKLGWKLVLMSMLLIYSSILSMYVSNYRRIVFPAVFNTVFIKIGLPVLVFLSYTEVIGETAFVNGWIAMFGGVLLLLIIYTYTLGALHIRPIFSKLRRGLIRQMGSFALFTGLSSIGNILAVRVDLIMLGLLTTMDDTGVYAIAMFIAGIIEIPTRAITQIASPIISQAWKDHDLSGIRSIYQKSSINLLIPGILLFIIIWHSADSLFQLTGRYDELIKGIWVIFFIGIARIVNMATSVNNQIIVYSKYYKYNLYFLLTLAGTNILLNYFLIRTYGIVGAAAATCISITLVNVVKLLFIQWKFGMQPFTGATLKLLFIGGIAFLPGMVFPFSVHPIVQIISISIISTLIYGSLSIRWHISQEMEDFVLKNIKKATQLFSK